MATLYSFDRLLEFAVMGGLLVVYLASFDLESGINQREVFSQDSVHIVEALVAERPYGWNPQHHLLYHTLVDGGYALWKSVFGHGRESVFRFLKLFSALTGLAFLLCLRWLLRDLGLDPLRRAAMLALAGVSVAAWFHFAGFETHGVALPFLALYALAVHRACRGERSWADRALLIGSLAVCVWARFELVALVLATAALPLLPPLRAARKTLWADAGLAAVLAALGSVWLAHVYLAVPLSEVPGQLVSRFDRPGLYAEQSGNLRPRFLLRTAAAFGVYPILAPAAGDAGDAVPTTHAYAAPDVEDPERGIFRCYFCTPIRSAAGHPLAFSAMAGWLALLGASVLRGARSIRLGDAFPLALGLAWLGGWLFYTWFNPREPFLWLGEFLVPLVALVAYTHRDASPRVWWGIAGLVPLVALHNGLFFYRGPAS